MENNSISFNIHTLASELESDLQDMWTGVRSGLLISMQGKLSWFRLTGLTMVPLM